MNFMGMHLAHKNHTDVNRKKNKKTYLIYNKETNKLKWKKEKKITKGNKFMYNGKPQKWQGEQRSFGARKLGILWYIIHTTESTGPNISILVNI